MQEVIVDGYKLTFKAPSATWRNNTADTPIKYADYGWFLPATLNQSAAVDY